MPFVILLWYMPDDSAFKGKFSAL